MNTSKQSVAVWYTQPWMAVFIALLACLAASICLFKVQPLIPVIMDYFAIGEAKAGMLMAVFSLSGIFLALPGAMAIRRFGIYSSGLAALLCLIIGSGVGLAGGVYGIMLLSRLIEGVGMALMAIIGIMAVSLVFIPEKRGAPMGIMCLYVTLGELSMLNLAPGMADSWGWQSVWWLVILFSALVFVIWLVCFRDLEKQHTDKQNQAEHINQAREKTVTQQPLSTVLANSQVWILVTAYTFFIIAYIGVFVFWPSYLNLEMSYPLARAASLVSLISLINIPFSFSSGILSDKLHSRKGVIFVAMLVCGLSYFCIPGSTGILLLLLLTLVGMFTITVPTVTFTTATEIFPDTGSGGIAVSLLTAGQNLGMFLGPALMGLLVEQYGWAMAFRSMSFLAIVGVGILCFYRPAQKKTP